MVPASLSSVLVSPGLVGFSGSRSSVPAVASSVVCLRFRSIGLSLVGCAAGVDWCFRAGLSGSAGPVQVFSASDFGVSRGSFAARSVAFVRALSAGGGVLVSFPSGVCPTGLLPSYSPSRCFSGLGSGSWASLAFAVGLGVQSFVFSPSGVPSGWGFVALGDGWFQFVSGGCQLGLF